MQKQYKNNLTDKAKSGILDYVKEDIALTLVKNIGSVYLQEEA